MRAKIIDGVFTLPPKTIRDGKTTIRNPSDNTLARLGWKLVVDKAQPECVGETHVEQIYTETENTIIRDWEVVEDSTTTKCARRREWFDVNYRKWNEMLTRYSVLKIEEEITDEYRGKTYKSLAELYAEAEVVRKEIQDMENPQ